jgi:hypothetical protein
MTVTQNKLEGILTPDLRSILETYGITMPNDGVQNNQHTFGPIEDILDVLKVKTKGANMDVQERYKMYGAEKKKTES